METNVKPMVTKDGMELETCSRCSGSGRYSWCQSHGYTCFKCAGKGVVMSKRGAAAAEYLEALRSKPASAIVVGDDVRDSGGRFYKVVEIVSGPSDCKIADGNGGMKRGEGVFYTFVDGTGCSHSGYEAAKLMRVRQTPEQVAETKAKAMAYQAALTTAGTPRKA